MDTTTTPQTETDTTMNTTTTQPAIGPDSPVPTIILCRGGRTGRKIHAAFPGSACTHCGHLMKYSAVNFSVGERTPENIEKHRDHLCKRCFPDPDYTIEYLRDRANKTDDAPDATPNDADPVAAETESCKPRRPRGECPGMTTGMAVGDDAPATNDATPNETDTTMTTPDETVFCDDAPAPRRILTQIERWGCTPGTMGSYKIESGTECSAVPTCIPRDNPTGWWIGTTDDGVTFRIQRPHFIILSPMAVVERDLRESETDDDDDVPDMGAHYDNAQSMAAESDADPFAQPIEPRADLDATRADFVPGVTHNDFPAIVRYMNTHHTLAGGMAAEPDAGLEIVDGGGDLTDLTDSDGLPVATFNLETDARAYRHAIYSAMTW